MTESYEELVQQFEESLRAKSRQPSTVESYSRDAHDFLRFMQVNGLTFKAVEPQTLIWFRDHLIHESEEAENSVRRKVIGVRQFYRFLVDERLISDSPFDNVPIPERDDALRSSVSENNFDRLLRLLPCENLKNARDRAILHLLAYEGIKANELIDLKWHDYLRGPRLQTLTIGGQKSRTIALQDESAASLELYAQTFRRWADSQLKGGEFPWIFVSFKGKESSLVLPHMTRHGLKFMLHELGERYAIKKLHTEGLRHHAIQYQLEQGRSAEDVMNHLGLRRLGNIGKHLAQRRMHP